MYTVVTGLFDIGRGNWNGYYNRSVDKYIGFFKNVLSLRVNMVVFIEEKFLSVVHEVRDNLYDQNGLKVDTIINVLKHEDLYMWKYKDLLFDIQKDINYGKGHPEPHCPEISEPMYSFIVNSKLDLLYRGSLQASTDYCIWLDGGYTHSNRDISKIVWTPTKCMSCTDKISMINLRPMSIMINDPVGFSNQYVDIINGGFIGGTKSTIALVRDKYYELVDEFLNVHRMKEDDQYYWTFLIKRNPNLFNLFHANWYDAFLID